MSPKTQNITPNLKKQLLKMDKPKVVLFDIDYTLFDVAKFRKKIFKSIIGFVGKNKIDKIDKILEDIYYASREKVGYFKMMSFLEDVNRKFKINVTLANILKDEMFSDNLYEETKEILESIAKDPSIKIGIFSGGESDFQFKKIEQLENFFSKDHVHIIKYKHLNISKIIQKYKNFRTYLIDDMLNILYNAKKIDKNIITVLIRRGRFAKNAKPIRGFKPDYEIKNLKEIIPVIRNS